MTAYPHLLSPLEIGNVAVRNRIMQTAHVKLWAYNAVDSERNVAYQAARAKGGAGLLITGNRVVHPTSTTGFPRVAWAYRPEALESDRRLTSAVHEHGAVIFAQLNHFGLNATSDSADDFRVLWGPSAVKSPAYGETPKAMEHEDIREVVEWWGRSAELTREGGFDGTEVHISHSYLLHQFLSPLYNKREDEYGGSFENRLRFAREVIEEVRARSRQRLGRRRPHQPDRLHPGRTRHRGRDPGCPAARGRRADRLRERDRGRLPQHLQGDRACRRARRLSRRPHRPGEGRRAELAGVHCRRHQGSGDGRGDPRKWQGGHGRHDPRADRRPRVREQGARRTRGRDRPLHPRQPGLHRPRLQGPADHMHREPGRRAGAAFRPGDAVADRSARRAGS